MWSQLKKWANTFQSPPHVQEKQSWGALQVFSLYRLLLIIVLITAFAMNVDILPLGRTDQNFYLDVLLGYLAFALICLMTSLYRKPPFNFQTVIQVLIDIFLLTLIIHSSRNQITVVGILMNAIIAGGSILNAGRTSIFFAAVATISILFEHAYSGLRGIPGQLDYSEIGIIGITFFATAILGYTLSRQIRASQALASQRGVDLARMEKLNEHIIQQLRSGIMVIDSEGRIHLMNDAACKLMGSELKRNGESLAKISPLLAEQLQSWQNGKLLITPFKIAENGTPVLAQFVPLGMIGKGSIVIFLDDLSLVAQQAQQMKLVSLGRLTASIAHEIRNPLGAVSHAAQLLEESTNLHESDIKLAGIIYQQTERMNSVVKNVLELSRRKDPEICLIQLKLWLENFVIDLSLLHPDLEIAINVTPENLVVYFDPSQMQQVLTNLCENGIRYSKLVIQRSKLELRATIDNSSSCHLEIIDYGTGVSDEMMQHLFEPFFSTEKTGTGLGLYMARELCEASQAQLSYRKLLEGGGCFRITFQRMGYY